MADKGDGDAVGMGVGVKVGKGVAGGNPIFGVLATSK